MSSRGRRRTTDRTTGVPNRTRESSATAPFESPASDSFTVDGDHDSPRSDRSFERGEPDPWPQFDRRGVLKLAGGAAVLGIASGSATASGGANDSVVWQFEADGFVESSPTIVDDTVYVGDEAGYLYAVDATTGEELWQYQTGAQIRSDLQVVGGTVYVGSTDHSVYAIDAEDGSQQWRFPTGSYVNSSPTRVDDTVYVASEDGNVYALDADDGAERWRFGTGDIVTNAPTVVDGVVYVGGHDHVVYAIDAEDGSEVWRHTTGLSISSEATVVDGTVYIGSDDATLYALDAADGGVVWRFTDPVAHVISATTYHDGVVFVATDDVTYGHGDDPTEAVLYAVDAASGDGLWEFAVEGSGNDWHFHASPTVADGIVYISNVDGTVYGLDAETGHPVFEFATDDAVWSSPTVVDGVLYVGSDDGHLYAIDVDGEGSSVDSRVDLGTLGHHDKWAIRAIEDDPGDPVETGPYHTTRDVAPEEVAVAIPGDLVFDPHFEAIADDVLDVGRLAYPGGTWVDADGTFRPPAPDWNGHVLFSETVLEDPAFGELAAAIADEELFPGDNWFPGDQIVGESVVAVDDEAVGRLYDGVPEDDLVGWLSRDGTFVVADADIEEHETVESGVIFIQGDDFIPHVSAFSSVESWFPGDMWFPGDTWFPGDSWFPGDHWFPGDSWLSDELFIGSGGGGGSGKALFVEAADCFTDHHDDLDPTWMAVLENGLTILPGDSWAHEDDDPIDPIDDDPDDTAEIGDDDTDDDPDDPADDEDDGMPGPGIVGALASLGGLSYLLVRRLDRLDDDR